MKKTVTLNPGESKVASFVFTPSEANVHSVLVNGLAGSFNAIQVAVGMITLYGTGVPPHSGAPWPTEWTVGWYYADRDTFLRNKEYYPPAGFVTPWKWITDPCTPPEPIDLNNLFVKIETYAEEEVCPLTGFLGACMWPVYGPFTVENGKVYTINVTTGVLTLK